MLLSDLSARSLEIFKELVDVYIETGEPVGSRTVSKRLSTTLSPATVRNIMAYLEDFGLLYAPHTSSGRLPTHSGLKLFVNGLLETSHIGKKELESIENCFQKDDIELKLNDVSHLLSGLSRCAGLVMAPKYNFPLHHIEFVRLSQNRILLILISHDGKIENRIITLDQDISDDFLAQADCYLKSRFFGKTLSEIRHILKKELDEQKLHDITKHIVCEGFMPEKQEIPHLIVKGQSHFIEDDYNVETVRKLFSALETQEILENLLDISLQSEGVQIFIGSENELFNLSGCSLIVSPYYNTNKQVIGALGVIGPSRMDYNRIIPIVDCTAKLLSKSFT